jgi:uncharacterized protein (DUF1778 family)
MGEKEKRERSIGVALTEEEYEAIRHAAYLSHKAMAAFVREMAIKAAKKINEKEKK